MSAGRGPDRLPRATLYSGTSHHLGPASPETGRVLAGDPNPTPTNGDNVWGPQPTEGQHGEWGTCPPGEHTALSWPRAHTPQPPAPAQHQRGHWWCWSPKAEVPWAAGHPSHLAGADPTGLPRVCVQGQAYSGTTCLICGFTYPSTALARGKKAALRPRAAGACCKPAVGLGAHAWPAAGPPWGWMQPWGRGML